MDKTFSKHLSGQLKLMQANGLLKIEREIISPQSSHIKLKGDQPALNFCSNNYLGLCDHADLIKAAEKSLHQYGLGMASVRFIAGTLDLHHALEKKISSFLQTEDTILYSSCFDANGGLFETLFEKEDAIISDELNHASIIDGIRLSKASRFRYKNNDLKDLELKLIEAGNAKFKVIATDGVFSMDGVIANLKGICDLADQYNALVMVDDCHAAGFMGENGRGTPEYCDVLGRVDIITGTFGKALGGSSGGYTSGKKEIIEWLRQRSRPYLFSNTLAPCIAGAALKAFELVETSKDLRNVLMEHTLYFRQKLTLLGFNIIPGVHPIIPIILRSAKLTQEFARLMLDHGIFVTGFFYPVVPEGKARIRVQISAAHSQHDLDTALNAFSLVGKQLGIL
jgi:glycine C-acetyltransferase